MRAIDAGFLHRLAESRSARIDIAFFNLPAREGNLSRMVGQMLRPLGQKYGWFGMVDDRHQYGGRTDRPHLGDLAHHRIGIVIAPRRRHTRICKAGRHIERQTLTHACKEFRRRKISDCFPHQNEIRLQLFIVSTLRNHTSGKLSQRACFRHGEELASREDTEHCRSLDVALLAERDEIVEQCAGDLSPQVATHM